jgi:SPP1 family predicted phage head-tail adaptor
MRAGALRNKITIYAQPSTQDSFGEPVAAEPVVFLKCCAAIALASSREIYALGPGFTSQVTHKITLRYPDTLPQAGMAVTYCGRTFVIQSVADPTERRRELDLMCLEKSK